MKPRTLGIDGCRAGWLAISLDAQQDSFWILASDSELKSLFDSFNYCFIDIPIGLEENKSVRTCDDLLRRVLGTAYRSSVFSPPVRAALITTDYVAGCDINQAKTGKRLSKQSWNITPKIRVVDEILQEDKTRANQVLESHPELLFKKLNRGGPTLAKKKTPEGIEQRLELLKNEDPRLPELFAKIRSSLKKGQAKDDDIVDALVLALIASRATSKPIRTLPLPPEIDRTGLPMAIHFV